MKQLVSVNPFDEDEDVVQVISSIVLAPAKSRTRSVVQPALPTPYGKSLRSEITPPAGTANKEASVKDKCFC